MDGAADITISLAGLSDGDRDAVDRLLPLVYDELHALAARSLRRERGDHTLQPTALVHEAYLRLVQQQGFAWQNRTHFFAIAAQAIRRILVDHARRHRSAKRKKPGERTPLEWVRDQSLASDVNVLSLDEALTELARTHARKAQVVEMRFFGGLTVAEVASALDIDTRTVERDWQFARAWLFRELAKGDTQVPPEAADAG